MKTQTDDLMSSIKEGYNPSIIASHISSFIVEALREKKINLYEAYLVNFEAIRFKRLAYSQPAWNKNNRPRITTCLDILNQEYLAYIFDELTVANLLKEWGIEAFKLSSPNRKHYIMDRYSLFLDAYEQPQLLKELLKYRQDYKKLNFDYGPYHIESFPYFYYSPEEILLDSAAKEKFKTSMSLNEDIENLIVELNLI